MQTGTIYEVIYIETSPKLLMIFAAQGNFSTLVASVTGIVKLGEEMGSFFTSMYENHTMLKQITCIMNDEDIGFDGGTDPFGSAHNHLRHVQHHLHIPHRHHHNDDVDLKLDLTKSDISNL